MRREVPSTRIRAHGNHFATIPSCGFYQLFFQSGAASYTGHASECLEHVRRRRGYRSVLIAIAAGLPSSGTKFQALATGADVCKPCPAQDRLASKAGSPRPRKFNAPRSSAEVVERVQLRVRGAPRTGAHPPRRCGALSCYPKVSETAARAKKAESGARRANSAP